MMPVTIRKCITYTFALLVLVNNIKAQTRTSGATRAKAAKTRNSASFGINFWLTSPGNSILFQKQQAPPTFVTTLNSNSVIEINERQSYQVMDGFGYCLTGGSAMLIHKMDAKSRAALLQELFGTGEKSIAVSYLRISIGASDLDDRVFSYDDLPAGETDPLLKKFSLDADRQHLIPVLKEILSIVPNIKILGSPWSAPTWMKTNDSSKGGSLKPGFYDAYANYFVKYIQGMKAEGIRINAITIQNEPLHPGNNPSMLMLAPQQATFVKNHLGPAFVKAGIKTKILIYDHNADRPDYPISILDDQEAAKYIDGSAFHLYAGPIEALSKVHEAHPDKNIYFTEQWVGAPGNLANELAWHVKNLIIGASRNWAKTVLEWNLAADPNQNPHTVGGCDKCLGAVTIDGNNVTRNPAYYIIAHASKFVQPGSARIASTIVDSLPNVAFLTPAGRTVVIVQNEGKTAKSFNLKYRNKTAVSTLKAGEVATYTW